MNSSSPPKHKTNFVDIARYALVAGFVLLEVFTVFLPRQTISQESLTTNCKNVDDPKPGVNCSYKKSNSDSLLPVCSQVTNPKHRENCMDLIDLPLCSAIDPILNSDGNNANPPLIKKNCVPECSTIAKDDSKTRGTDYAIHGTHCIRFCDAPEDGVTINADKTNCVVRKCHQLNLGTNPDPDSSKPNCDLIPCYQLTPDELNDTRLSDEDDYKYCRGEVSSSADNGPYRCYQFSEAQLPFVRYRSKNSMCVIHNCKPASNSCGYDDTKNITEKYGTDESQKARNQLYTTTYEKYITGGQLISGNAVCNRVKCKPVITSQEICSADSSDALTVRNRECDTTSVCENGFCTKTTDCNLSENISKPECTESTLAPADISDDSLNAWFYYPKPSHKSMRIVDGKLTFREMNKDEICFPDSGVGLARPFCEQPENGTCSGPDCETYCYATVKNSRLKNFWHTEFSPYVTRSPGVCATSTSSTIGSGYIYLCGNEGSLYGQISDQTAYYRGPARLTSKGTYKITVCLRFKNLGRPIDISKTDSETCGKRECAVNCSGKTCSSQLCGNDTCFDLEIKGDKECDLNKDLFNYQTGENTSNRPCLKFADSFLRLRAVKYKNHICAFLDAKGHTSYPSKEEMFSNGQEQITFDGISYCLAGTKDDSGRCKQGGEDSQNTRENDWRADLWRNVLRVKYIQNNMAEDDDLKGIYDLYGNFRPAMECPKIPLRVGPPEFYNVATIQNSPKIFTPPLYIANARVKQGGSISLPDPTSTEKFGQTDFHFPEIEVKFGTDSKLLSLSMEDSGGEFSTNEKSNTVISTIADKVEFRMEIFVTKEYDVREAQPKFCLYRRVKNQASEYQKPIQIGCVDRNLPEINSSEVNRRQVLVSPNPSNNFKAAKIDIRYLDGGPDGLSSNCYGDDICSTTITLENTKFPNKNCTSDGDGAPLESYPICIQREECSKLNIECLANEIKLNDAIEKGESTAEFEAYRNVNCGEDFTRHCNQKFGINSPQSNFISDDQIPAENQYHYGWFNEICITSGFDKKLKKVLAYDRLPKGKCVIDTSKSTGADCSRGGNGRDCICKFTDATVTTEDGKIIRTQTPREAGLCIDIDKPPLCPKIDYNQNPNSDQSDPDWVLDSLNGSLYKDQTGFVNLSHKSRTLGSSSGHAEFPATAVGIQNATGQCIGFWKNDVTSSGVTQKPKMECKLNSNGTASWTNMRNSCVRFSCPAIQPQDADAQGNYSQNYTTLLETDEESKGRSHGYAKWPQSAKTGGTDTKGDFPERFSASECIAGFKAVGSTSQRDIDQKIIKYTGGTLPSRMCNQTGNWINDINGTSVIENLCERIRCPQIQGDDITSIGLGASFPSTKASRNKLFITPGSIATGTCNESIGFRAVNGIQPIRSCDYLGNWTEVINPCVRHCEAVDSPVANNPNHGFAKWSELNTSKTSESVASLGCVDGYKKYPYPPRYDEKGEPLQNADNLDREIEDKARRTCKYDADKKANVWTSPSSTCIRQCPGKDIDDRIGVGRTTHVLSPGNRNVTVEWPSTDGGKWATISSPNVNGNPEDISGQNASDYQRYRRNGYYILKRYCDPNTLKWEDPLPACATRGGTIGSEIFGDSTSSVGNQTSDNFILIEDANGNQTHNLQQTVQGECSDGYKTPKDGSAILSRRCYWDGGSKEIDKVYLKDYSGKTCDRICKIADGNPTYGNTIYNESSVGKWVYAQSGVEITKADGSSSIRCKDGFYTSSTCGSPGSRPYLTCEADGTLQLHNNCQTCKCSLNQSWNPEVNPDATGSANGYMRVRNMNMNDVLWFYFIVRGPDDCELWEFKSSCSMNEGYRVITNQVLDLKEGSSNCGIKDNNAREMADTLRPQNEQERCIFAFVSRPTLSAGDCDQGGAYCYASQGCSTQVSDYESSQLWQGIGTY